MQINLSKKKTSFSLTIEQMEITNKKILRHFYEYFPSTGIDHFVHATLTVLNFPRHLTIKLRCFSGNEKSK